MKTINQEAMDIKEIKKLPLKEVFGKEDEGFTPWLVNHIDWLSEAIGIPLAAPRAEVALETLRPDIIAYTDPTEGDEVIIENQYDKSDSYHIGKLLTYAAYEKKAKYAVLITEDARIEHIEAVKAMNEVHICGCHFFLVNASAYKISDKEFTILFNVVVGGNVPNAAQNEKQATLSEFWSFFIKKAGEKNVGMYAKLKQGEGRNLNNWLYAYIGKANAHFVAKVTKSNASVYFLLDSADDQLNSQRFATLQANRAVIDDKFGEGLSWNNTEGQVSCKIEYTIDNLGGYENKMGWDKLVDRMLDVVKGMNEALSPYYKQL